MAQVSLQSDGFIGGVEQGNEARMDTWRGRLVQLLCQRAPRACAPLQHLWRMRSSHGPSLSMGGHLCWVEEPEAIYPHELVDILDLRDHDLNNAQPKRFGGHAFGSRW